MDAAQTQMQMQPVAQQQYPVMQQQDMMMNGPGAANASPVSYQQPAYYPPAAQNVIRVQPVPELPAGPGAAGAETLSKPIEVVSSSLAPDLSFLDKK
jgi:hypothetical protein